jgi:2,3-bisphosphoglycerate-independent phosphoglycerate mutase
LAAILPWTSDNRWERVKKAYDLMVNAEGTHAENLITAISQSYSAGVTDEFVLNRL